MSQRLLLLAGTAEARSVAEGLAGRPEIDAIASFAGTTKAPKPLPIPTRIGGFGGDDGFRAYLASERITAVLDATHPYAARISARSARICAERGLPHARLLRPEWRPEAGDDWIHARDEADVARHLPAGARVFLATGPEKLAAYEGLAPFHILCRRVDPAPGPFPLPHGEWILGRPPFREEEERALFRRFRVDVLVTKNSGGASGRAKLRAARTLGLPVIMVARPEPPKGLILESPEAALDWVRQQIG